MAKDFATGIVLTGEEVDWTSFQKVKGSMQKIASGAEDISGISGDVTACMRSEQVLMRVIELPHVDDDELSSMVELQVDKFSPFPAETLVVSYEILDKRVENYLILAIAVKEEVIEDYGQMLKDIGVKLASIDLDVMCWLRILRDEGRIHPDGRQVIVVMADVPVMVIIQDAVPVAFRSLAVAEGMDSDELLREIAEETSYTLMSIELEHGASPVASLDVYCDSNLSVESLDVLEQECGSVPNVHELSGLPALSEGAAKRAADDAVSKLDLTPQSWRAAESSKKNKKNIITLVAVLTFIWMLAAGGFFGYLFYQEKILDELRIEKERWAAPAKEVRDMSRRVRLIELYMDRTDSALECLREVTQLLPATGIELSTFNYKKGEAITLTGEADAHSVVLAFNDNLTKSRLFSRVVPGDIKILRGKHRFSLVLEFIGEESE